MSAVDDILSQIPLSQLAAQLGTDEQTAEAATRSALPALLGGLEANAQDPARAASLTEALGQHDSSLVDGGVDLDQVNTGEGQKIVSHIFGGNQESIVNELGALPPGAAGLSGPGGAMGSGMLQKLLPILAPIVMSYLAKRFTGGGGLGGSQGGMSGILGSVLGGMGGQGNQGAGGIGAILSGISGQGSPDGGGINNILGGLLGQGRR
jgi:hypothetical protein